MISNLYISDGQRMKKDIKKIALFLALGLSLTACASREENQTVAYKNGKISSCEEKPIDKNTLGYLVTDDGAKPVWIFSLEFAHDDVNFYIYDAVNGENIYDIHKSN